MTIREICKHLNAEIKTGNANIDNEIKYGFASDLLSDVLTLDTNSFLLITGTCNIQAVRTAEMADVSCILFVRGKKATPEMITLAAENDIVILECQYSMYRTIGILYSLDLPPVY